MKKENTREKIILTATKLFQEKGYEGVRMQEIADSAEINKGLLHYYFKSKENIFIEVFESAFSTLIGKLKSSIEKDLNLFDKIDLIISNYIDVLLKNRFLPLFIFQELNRNPEFLLKKFDEQQSSSFIKNFLLEIKSEQEKGNIKQINPLHLLLNILGMTIFPFVAGNAVIKLFDIPKKQYDLVLLERKKIISDFVKSALEIK